MGFADDAVIGREYVFEGWNTMAAIQTYVEDSGKREEAADKRTLALLKVHEEGWKRLAGAVQHGLADIANAIRGIEVTGE